MKKGYLKATASLVGLFVMALVAASLILFTGVAEAASSYKIKGVPTPGEYGTIVLNKKTGEGQAMPAVVFPHWWHRTQYTCNVCHTELGFPFKAGKTDFVMSEIFAGKQCGACHNGTMAFAPMDCNRCHSQGQDVPQNRKIENTLSALPKDDFGNKVDWVEALRKKHIEPKASLDGTGEMVALDMKLIITSKHFRPAPPNVIYPHKAHTEWLDCTNCHPAIFKMKYQGNPKMDMLQIISGKYCGVCHGKVAFPLENCFRCHSSTPEKVPEIDRAGRPKP